MLLSFIKNGVICFESFYSIHWIPTECYSNFDHARGSVAADVWAFGTTLWEIFAYGECPPESSNVSSVKKVQFNIFVCCNCYQVFTFLNILYCFIGYTPSCYSDADTVMLQYYQEDKKLPAPFGCPSHMYKLMLQCWDLNPHSRKKPQAIMRDMNQILYEGIVTLSFS
jgi:hypothetical protein